eukprot:698084-Rhodomonas_salina.1
MEVGAQPGRCARVTLVQHVARRDAENDVMLRGLARDHAPECLLGKERGREGGREGGRQARGRGSWSERWGYQALQGE